MLMRPVSQEIARGRIIIIIIIVIVSFVGKYSLFIVRWDIPSNYDGQVYVNFLLLFPATLAKDFSKKAHFVSALYLSATRVS